MAWRPAQVLAVRGYADRKLLRPDDPLHFSNRRVSILVAYTKKRAVRSRPNSERQR